MKSATKSKNLQSLWRELEECRGLFVPEWQQLGAENLFTARQGGTSKGAYASLNMGLHVEDDAQAVIENRRRIAQKLKFDLAQMVYCEQVHGTDIQRVTTQQRGAGVFHYHEAIAHTDALITNEPQVYLTLLFADCIPLFFFDPVTRAIGVAHGGWKGAWGEIGVKTIAAMQREFGCQVQNVQCWIGPGIGPCCFEIGEDLAQKVQGRKDWKAYVQVRPDGKYVWDLAHTHEHMLLECGVLPENLLVSTVCTRCHETEFFSYRRDQGKTGRMAAILGLQ